jgi:6-phosphogluconate dehydrogenase
MKELGIVGLGKMGGNIARRLHRSGIKVVLFDQNVSTTKALASELGAVATNNLTELTQNLTAPQAIWLMLPAGEITETTIKTLTPFLTADDILIDGANSFYKDSQRRAKQLEASKIDFVDVGVSGGIWGEKNGYALMIGGTQKAVQRLEPIFKCLAPAIDKGWHHCGPNGAGHFVKMIHNGIEYGMMQAYAEGLSLLHNKKEFDVDLAKVTEMWRHGSVVRSWLLDLIVDFLGKDKNAAFENIAPFVADSGEGRWTAMEGIEQGIPTPVISTSLMARFNSQGRDDFAAQLLAMMRKGFGGHDIIKR